MTQKLFLTSALAMGVMAPAFAEPSHTDSFPNDGLMQEDYTYTNAATSTNMDGVYSGTVNAVAEYDIIDYIVNAGQYLPADSETVITCPAGSYCPGISGNVQYNQSSDQGIQTCPTGYTSSAAGASSDTQCYRACDMNNMGTSFTNIAHATAVTGNDYYGNGTDTCEPTACVNGWHLKTSMSGSELVTAIGTGLGENSAYVANSGSFGERNHDGQGAKGASYYGLSTSNPNTWAVDYGTHGMLTGQARCSTQAGNNGSFTWRNQTITSNLADETGQEGAKYCYCNVTGYTPDGGTLQSLSSPWVFYGDDGDIGFCAATCARDCAGLIGDPNNPAFRAAVLGSVQPGLASCEANVININWSDASAADISANNAGTATYGEDVRTPVKAATKKGQTFRGWRFSAPEQVSTGN